MATPKDFYRPFHMVDTDTLLVDKGPIYLHSVIINSISGGSITVYNGIDATGDVVLILTVESGQGTYVYDIRLDAGLYIETVATCDVTITVL